MHGDTHWRVGGRFEERHVLKLWDRFSLSTLKMNWVKDSYKIAVTLSNHSGYYFFQAQQSQAYAVFYIDI